MKKKFGLLLTLLFLSGCTVEYNANITRENVTEMATIDEVINETYPVTAYINDQGPSETNDKTPGIDYYEIVANNNTMMFKYTFPFNRYLEGTGVNYCYKEVNMKKLEQNQYKITTSNYNSCIDFYNEIDQIKINLTFANEFTITNHNADQVNNHTYTWLINRANYQNKAIEITYSINEETSAQEKVNLPKWLIILSSFLLLGIILTIVIKFKNKSWKGK